MNSITYLTIPYERNFVLKKLKLSEDWWKNKNREKWGLNKFGTEIHPQCRHKQNLRLRV